jgi:hypothetical protein
MPQLLLSQLSHGGDQDIALGVTRYEAHGRGRGLALTVGVIDQELVGVGEHDGEPSLGVWVLR